MGKRTIVPCVSPNLTGYKRLFGRKFQPVISQAFVTKRKTRSVTKRLLQIASIDPTIHDIRADGLDIFAITSKLEEEIADLEADQDQTVALPGNSRPNSRPLLSSTRDDLDDEISAILNDISDLNDVTDIIRHSKSVFSDGFLTCDNSQVEPGAAGATEAASPPRRNIRKEIWEVAKTLSTSGSPTRSTAALVIIADEASRSVAAEEQLEQPLGVHDPEDTLHTDDSLEKSVDLPVTPDPDIIIVAAMTPAEEAAAKLLAAKIDAATDVYLEASMFWEEVSEMNITTKPKDALNKLAADADAFKHLLGKQYIAVRTLTAEQLGEVGEPANLKVLKDHLVSFRDKAWDQVNSLDVLAHTREPLSIPPTPTAAAPSVDVRAAGSQGMNVAANEFVANTPAAAGAVGQPVNGTEAAAAVSTAAAPSQEALRPPLQIRSAPTPLPRIHSALSGMSSNTEEVVTNRVNSRKPALLENAATIIERLENLLNRHPVNNSELQELDNTLDIVKLEAKDAIEDLKELLTLAMSVGLGDAARDLGDAVDAVGAARTEAITSVRGARHELGIPMGAAIGALHLNLKCPMFKGDYKEKMDWYTFEREFNDYMGSIGCRSHGEKLLKLRNDCLQGAAKDAAASAKTWPQAMDILREMFAKPEILLALRTKDVLDEGTCPEGLMEKRRWFINISNKFRDLREIAETHQIDDFLAASDISNLIIQNMPRWEKNEFEKKMINHRLNTNGLRVTRKVIAARLDSFIEETIAKLACTLDYRITNQFGDAKAMMTNLLSDGKKAPVKTAPNAGGRRGVHVAGVGESDNASTDSGASANSSGAASQPPKASKRKKKSSKQPGTDAPASSSSTSIAVANTGSKIDWENRPLVVNRSKTPKSMRCKLCIEAGHKPTEHESLIYCPEFRKARVPDRFGIAMRSNTCFRCLRCDSGFILKKREEWFNLHKDFCSDRYVCKHGPCAQNEPVKQNHLLICKHHEDENRADHSEFLASVDMDKVKINKKFFFVSPTVPEVGVYATSVPGTRAAKQPIYMLQMIPGRNGEGLLLFFDTGCVEATLSDRAYSLLDTIPGRPGPINLDVAGGQQITNPHGYETFKIKKTDGGIADIHGLRMPEITSELPLWELTTAFNDVVKGYQGTGGQLDDLPTCPTRIGGNSVDVMLGVEYLSCFPDLVFELPGGLRLYKSRLEGVDGHLGILGGPSDAWNFATNAAHVLGPRVYFTAEARAVHSMNISLKTQFKLESPCVPEHVEAGQKIVMSVCPECHCYESMMDEAPEVGDSETYKAVFHSISGELRRFQDVENLGGGIDYRCVVCRNCAACKNGEILEHLSLQEEKEQAQIEECVTLDRSTNTVYTKLPFIKDPDEKLKPNRRIAAKVLDTQIRIMDKTPGMKESVMKAHDKLLSRGHVIALQGLPDEIRKGVAQGSHYFIPWRTVLNLGSLSTPRRLVFDASARTPGGESLNDILARGMNKLGKLLHLLVKFRYGCYAFSADVQMAYNNLKLDPDFYKYQQYLWKENLSAEEEATVMVVVTAIYGVRPAGNLTLAAFMKIVEAGKELGGQYAVGALALEMCSYMDDIFSAHGTKAGRDAAAEGLVKVLELGSMSVKAITKSGAPPPDDVTADGTTIGVVGYRWDTAKDTMKLDVKPITLSKTKRGQPGAPVEGDLFAALKEKFTKRVLAGRVASVYDPLGLVTPITAKLKVDMSGVCKVAENWDSSLPAEMIPTWVHNLEQIRELDDVEVPRNVSVSRDGEFMFDMIVCVDASETVAAAAVYARTETDPGVFDCNLLIAKSKLSHLNTIPKGEMRAATLGGALAHIVRTNLGEYIRREIFVTDSTISLCWLNQDQRPLQISVRNSVIAVRRFSSLDDWYHVASEDNPADIATRPVLVEEIKGESDWFKGRPWMRGPVDEMPLRQVQDLKLSKEEQVAVAAEIRSKPATGMILFCKVSRLSSRYKYSKYLLDPCSMPWPKYLRVLSVVIRGFQIWWRRNKLYKGNWQPKYFPKVKGRPVPEVTFEDLEEAKLYTFRKTSAEVKYFNKKEDYSKLCSNQNGVLVYIGRILDGDKPDSIAGAMLDLGPLTFCQPVLDRYSPVSYAIMMHVHGSINHHGGAKTSYRRSLEYAHVLKGLKLAEEIRDGCPHCQRYKARLVQAVMGKIHFSRYTPAPPFYFCQADLVGPWIAKCENHPWNNPKGAPVKVWGAVFKCATTLAVSIEVMPDYSASSFVNSYIRFSSRYGHPGVMFIDPGSNVVSACNSMTISYADISKTLNGKGVAVRHEMCVTGSHEGQGLVERSIREVRKIFNAVFKPFELSITGYSTAFAFIANELNNIPICLGSKYTNLEELDLITPNRLLLGRNNLRAPIGLVEANVPSMWLDTVEDVSRSWWKVWESEWLVHLIPQPSKWTVGSADVEVGDIVVFMKEGHEAVIGQTPWRTGQVEEAPLSTDGICRRVTLKYKNCDEKVYRYTERSVRTLAVLHREGDVDILGELSQANIDADRHFMINFWVPKKCETGGEVKGPKKCETGGDVEKVI